MENTTVFMKDACNVVTQSSQRNHRNKVTQLSHRLRQNLHFLSINFKGRQRVWATLILHASMGCGNHFPSGGSHAYLTSWWYKKAYLSSKHSQDTLQLVQGRIVGMLPVQEAIIAHTTC